MYIITYIKDVLGHIKNTWFVHKDYFILYIVRYNMIEGYAL